MIGIMAELEEEFVRYVCERLSFSKGFPYLREAGRGFSVREDFL